MRPDVVGISSFYATALGRLTARLVAGRLAQMHPKRPDRRILAIGYGVPYLSERLEDHERIVAMMPARQGAISWPPEGRNRSLLGEPEHLPFADAMFDQVILIHCLEYTAHAGSVLKEARRVLAPGGRVVCVVPNRLGAWSRSDATPFGNGRPFSSSQLRQLIDRAQLSPRAWEMALMLPPLKPLHRLMPLIEPIGRTLWPKIGGVYVVEAEKVVFTARTARRTQHAPIPIGVPGLATPVRVARTPLGFTPQQK